MIVVKPTDLHWDRSMNTKVIEEYSKKLHELLIFESNTYSNILIYLIDSLRLVVQESKIDIELQKEYLDKELKKYFRYSMY